MSKRKVKVKVLPFHEAIHVALSHKMSELAGRAKRESVSKYEYRVKSFLSHEYQPSLGLVGSIQAYLNRLKLAGKSASYVRGMKSTLNGFLACLPTCQISMFSGVTI
jgi:hypothetical protein